MSGWARGLAVYALIGLATGLAVGLAVGWFWPVQYQDTEPSVLRQDYLDDYIVMVATSYEIEGDLDRARQRLALLDPQEPTAPVVELTERLVEAGGSSQDVRRLARLAWDLKAVTPTADVPAEGGP